MPARSSTDVPDTGGAIRSAVIRLSRLDGDGGAVIERAAIVAEGAPAAEIEAWVLSHGGEPEVPLVTARDGLHGPRLMAARPPRRYVLPAAVLA
jgi:hypothetical protein